MLLFASVLSAGQVSADPNDPLVLEPPEDADLATSRAYVRIQVLAGETFEVWLEPEGEAPEDITAAFSFATSAPSSREIHHGLIAVPVGDQELWVVQHVASPSETFDSSIRSFSRVEGAVRELGPIDDAGGGVLGTTLEGALERASGPSWLLFGETTLSGPLVYPTAQAGSSDTDASDGIDLTWYADPSPIVPVLGLAAADPSDADEEDVWLTAPFERGSDVFAFYQRIDRDATPIQQGIGLAKATGGALPFSRLTFAAAQPPGGGHFDDTYSIFQASEFPRVRGVLPSGSYVLLFGQREGGSGLAADREIVVARAPLSTVEDRATYQYWTEVTGTRAWRSSSTGLVVLFKNASAPSVAWSVELGRWLATSTQEQGALPPYTVTGARSAIQLRVADDPRGPWSPPVTVWDLPVAVNGAAGTALEAIHLSGFDSGDFAYLAATDASEVSSPPLVQLYEVDLPAAGLPSGPVAPQIVTASGSTGANPTVVKGYAAPGDTVRLVINGTAQWLTDVADADGLFEIDAALYDGTNTIQATATKNGLTSQPSASITLTYTNTIVRTIGGSSLNISVNTVWTPGASSPYLITGTLNIAPNTYLVLQAGVALRFQNTSSALLVRGELRIVGTSASPVKLSGGVADPLTCTTIPGWAGIDVNDNATGGTGVATIEFAQIGCASRGIEVIGDTATVRDTTIYNSQTYGISVTAGGTATIERVTIDRATNGGSAGIELSQAGAVTIADSTIRRSVDGIRMTQSSPTIEGSLFELNTTGVNIQRDSDPEITGNTIKSNTGRGIWVVGNSIAAQDPEPQINENDIHLNFTNLQLQAFGDALRLVEARDNWWGSADPATIGLKLADASDGTNGSPFARFAPYLDASIASGGESVPGNYLNGPATGALVPGEPYVVVGKVLVPAGALSTLTIQAGSELRFHGGTMLEAKGLLTVAGTQAQPVQLHSAKPTPGVGDWEGIRVVGTGAAGSLIEHAIVDHAFIGVLIDDTFATVRDSTIREFGRAGGPLGAGIWIDGEGGPTDPKATVRGNQLSKDLGGSESEYGIYAIFASPLLEDNDVRDAYQGVHLRGPAGVGSTPIAPTVIGNTIEGNATGVRIEAHADPVLTGNRIQGNPQGGIVVIGLFNAAIDPRPAVHENEISGNGTLDVSTNNFGVPTVSVVDFERNWWGTTDLAAIAARISDQSEAPNAPIVDFAPPLDGIGGAPLAGQYLSGPTAPGATIAAGTYQVVGGLTVPVGETLVIQGGARLEFLPGSKLLVKGSLDVQGGPGSLVVFTANGALPTPGAWAGIVVDPTATNTVFDYVRVEYATRGIDVRANGTIITHSEFGNVPVSGWGIYATGVSGGTIAGNTLDNDLTHDGVGIELLNANLTIDANLIQGFSTGIWLTQSAPLITANTLQAQFSAGLRIGYGSSPTVTNGNLIQQNGTGILVSGSGNAAQNPNPTIQGNQILNNTGYELSSGGYGSASSATLAATLNYWGSESTATIGASIFDRTDAGNTSAPTVVFTPYLDDDLQPVSGNFLNGTLTADLTIATGTTWDVVGDLTVPTGRLLTVSAGATLRFAPSTALRVSGTLDVNGTSSQRATFTSATATPTQSTWDGIAITGGTSTIDFARVEYADRAIDVRNAAVDVRDSQIYDFGRLQGSIGYVGIYYQNATGTIDGNTVEQHGSYTGWPATGILLFGAEPTVSDNTIHAASTGLRIQGPSSGAQSEPAVTGNTIYGNSQVGIDVSSNASPVIDGGNVVTANAAGIKVGTIIGDSNPARDPAPVVSGNDLAGNTSFDYVVGGFADHEGPPLDAEGNWWGIATVQGIANRILDSGDGSNSDRAVDFAPFLDASVGSGGQPVAGNYLVGPLGGGTTLVDGATYEVTGPIRVLAGQTVTIEAGAVLEFANHAAFEIAGTLEVEGTSADPVLFTSAAGAGPGDWKGLVVSATSTNSSLANVRIEYAEIGIRVDDASIEVTDSEIEFFEDYGIFFINNSGGAVDGTLIRQGSKLGTGIFMQTSSPTLTGNDIRDNEYGIHIQWGSNPVISDGNTITSNLRGIQLEGGHVPNAGVHPNPVPTINGNNIYANRPNGGTVDVNVWVHDFWYPGTTEKLDMQENWWGTSVAADIKATFKLDDHPPTVIDFSGRLDGLDGDPIAGAKFSNTLLNVRHNAQTFRPAFSDTVGVDFDLLEAGTVDFIVYHEDDSTLSNPIRTITQTFGAGPHQISWDGKDGAGIFQNNGAYRYVMKVDGGVAATYDPRIGDIPQVGSVTAGAQTPTFNAFTGESWKRPVTISESSRRLALSIAPEGKPPFLLFDQVCYAPSPTPHIITWDGIDPTGTPVVGPVYLNILDLNRNVTPNHFVIYAVDPKVTGPTSVPAPTIEVKSNPSLVYHSYDQLTKITYEIDRQATVTVKLLPPGIIDPNAPTAIALLSAQSQSAGEHSVTWRGHDGVDTNAIEASAEGPYTFLIQATGASTGKSSTSRGVLTLRK